MGADHFLLGDLEPALDLRHSDRAGGEVRSQTDGERMQFIRAASVFVAGLTSGCVGTLSEEASDPPPPQPWPAPAWELVRAAAYGEQSEPGEVSWTPRMDSAELAPILNAYEAAVVARGLPVAVLGDPISGQVTAQDGRVIEVVGWGAEDGAASLVELRHRAGRVVWLEYVDPTTPELRVIVPAPEGPLDLPFTDFLTQLPWSSTGDVGRSAAPLLRPPTTCNGAADLACDALNAAAALRSFFGCRAAGVIVATAACAALIGTPILGDEAVCAAVVGWLAVSYICAGAAIGTFETLHAACTATVGCTLGAFGFSGCSCWREVSCDSCVGVCADIVSTGICHLAGRAGVRTSRGHDSPIQNVICRALRLTGSRGPLSRNALACASYLRDVCAHATESSASFACARGVCPLAAEALECCGDGACAVWERDACSADCTSCVARAETCNGEDDDCDGAADEGNPGGGGACGSSIGACEPGTLTCRGGALVCVGQTAPRAEACNGVDDDCDGTADEGCSGGCVCTSGACCDGCRHRVAGTTCAPNVAQENVCAGGLGCGGDVYRRGQDRTCSGSSASCDGPLVWREPIVIADCGPSEVCVPGSATCASMPSCSCACTTGPCCDGCNLFPSTRVCQAGLAHEFLCADGTSCGRDVFVREQVRHCSGTSAACSGMLAWTTPTVVDACTAMERCTPGASACAADPSCSSCTLQHSEAFSITYGPVACRDNHPIRSTPLLEVWVNEGRTSCTTVTVAGTGSRLRIAHNSDPLAYNGTITVGVVSSASPVRVVAVGSFSAGLRLQAVFGASRSAPLDLTTDRTSVELTLPSGGPTLVLEFQNLGPDDVLEIDQVDIFVCP